MTALEYIQLKAYARQDGFFLALLWIASFTFYIMGLTNQMLGMAAIMLAVATPFFVAGRLRRFRDEGREGVISFRRGYAYTILVFFYGAVLLAVAQFLYFAYLDNGYLMTSFSKIVSSSEGQALLKEYGMTKVMNDSLTEMASVRPIDYALNILTVNIMIGFVLGVPIGLAMNKSTKTDIEK
jgi:hypothetical protein